MKSDSKYIKINLKDKKTDLQENSKIAADVYISSAYADKFSLKPGDAITLKEKYEKETYTFRVKGIYSYNGGPGSYTHLDDWNEAGRGKKNRFCY